MCAELTLRCYHNKLQTNKKEFKGKFIHSSLRSIHRRICDVWLCVLVSETNATSQTSSNVNIWFRFGDFSVTISFTQVITHLNFIVHTRQVLWFNVFITESLKCKITISLSSSLTQYIASMRAHGVDDDAKRKNEKNRELEKLRGSEGTLAIASLDRIHFHVPLTSQEEKKLVY